MSGWKSAFAPATIANVGPGFDVLGLALDPATGLGDRCDARLTDSGITLEVTGDGGRLSVDPDKNVVGVVARAVLELAGARTGLALRLTKGLPLGSGLGSSAASAAAAALATNEALGCPLTPEQLIPAGRIGEGLASGSPHPDNVVPALLGGAVLVVDTETEPGRGAFSRLSLVRLPVPTALRAVVAIPQLELNTADSRRALPKTVPHGDAVFNAGRLALLVSALYDADFPRISAGVADRLHQPYRIPLVRGFEQARAAALAAGALGVGLSGSGPAIFALTTDEHAAAVQAAFISGWAEAGVTARAVVSALPSCR